MNDNERELSLYIANCTRACALVEAIARNYERKIIKGTYDSSLAAKGLAYAVETGAKEYVREFCTRGDKWFDMFSKRERETIANELARHLEIEWKAGNYWGPREVKSAIAAQF